jgi:16S rRNA (guanine527-N7)-methyltransferase
MRGGEQELRAGLKALQLDLGDAQVGQLLDYQDLIGKWTKVYNLTAVRDPAEMMTHHLLDSLAAVFRCALSAKSRAGAGRPLAGCGFGRRPSGCRYRDLLPPMWR